MRLLACLIVAPQRGYDEPATLSYAISSFCPTSADGLHFCSRTCAIMTSAVWRPEPLGKIIRRKLMPNFKHVTWRYPTLTPSRLAISSRLIPWATKSLISSITSGVNCTPSAPKDGLALVIVMTGLFGSRRVVVVFLVGLVSDVRCDGHHEMVDSG